jgi:hypothetical protein
LIDNLAMRAVQFLLDLLTPAEVGEVISKTKRKSFAQTPKKYFSYNYNISYQLKLHDNLKESVLAILNI